MKSKSIYWNIYFLKSNTYFWGTVFFVQDEFLYLIVNKQKLTVQLLGTMFYPGNPSWPVTILFTQIGRFVFIFNLAKILEEPEAQLRRIYLFNCYVLISLIEYRCSCQIQNPWLRDKVDSGLQGFFEPLRNWKQQRPSRSYCQLQHKGLTVDITPKKRKKKSNNPSANCHLYFMFRWR